MNTNELQQAIYAREVASAYYLRNPRVTLIDVGWKITNGVYTSELAVRVHLRNKPSQTAIESLTRSSPELVIDKNRIPFTVDIIEGRYPLNWYWWDPQPAPPRASRFNPLQGGISISGEWIFGYGTLGGIVQDRASGEKMILSNWHVLAGSDYGVPGTQIFQPGYGDYGRGADTVALLERHAFDQGIDAAVARLNGQREWINDQFGIDPDNGCPVTGCGAPALDMRVVKSGRASGVTHGFIDGIEGEYPISYNGIPHSIKYISRIVPQPGYHEVSRPGDSGSWWLEEDSHQAVGLHFAGETAAEAALAIAMPQVLDSLDVNIARAAPGQATTLVPEPAPFPAGG